MNSFRRPIPLISALPKHRPIKFKHNIYGNCQLHVLQTNLCDPLKEFLGVQFVLKRLKYCSCRVFCTKSDDTSTKFTKRKDEIKAYLEHNKEKLRDTEQRLKERGYVILQDLKDTKSKVKEKVEEIVEFHKNFIYTVYFFEYLLVVSTEHRPSSSRGVHNMPSDSGVQGSPSPQIEKENIYTIPNLLTVSRMVISPYLGFLIVQGNFNFALGVLGFAAVTDLVYLKISRYRTGFYNAVLKVNSLKPILVVANVLDGWIARTWESQSSKMGSFLDPMADKILIATLFLTLTYANLIPVILTGLIITRDVLLVIAGFVIRYKSLPPPRTFLRYFDATNVTAQLAPTFISKVNTAVQLLLVGTTLAAPVFEFVNHPVLQGLWYVTAGTTIAAALSYILSKNTYKILTKVPDSKTK